MTFDWNAKGIQLPNNIIGVETDTLCPQCSHTREKKLHPCLSVNLESGRFFCHHCNWKGVADNLDKSSTVIIPRKIDVTSIHTRPTIYKKPENLEYSEDKEKFYGFFDKRGISKSTVDALKIEYGRHYMMGIQDYTNTIMFRYFKNGELVNVKFRDKDKNYQLVGGAERCLYNIDACEASDVVIICEGEMDAATVVECGINEVMSVPDGAPVPDAKTYNNKFEFLNDEKAVRLFSEVKSVILAVDNDAPGLALREELARRIGKEKCYTVEYPDGCKDLNDVLVAHGSEAVVSVLKSAMAYPIEGIVEFNSFDDAIDELYEKGVNRGISVGIDGIDPFYTVKTGYWTVVTGAPSHGKSEIMDAMAVNLASLHGWKFAVCSPENYPLEYHFSKLAEKYIGKPFFAPDSFLSDTTGIERMSVEEKDRAKIWAKEHFKFIYPETLSLDAILEATKVVIMRYGVKGLVIDPWNQLEHSRPSHQSETEYISDSLTKIQRFAQVHDIHIWVVAHPTKLQKLDDGTYPVPTPYDISGSANWFNKSDFALAIHRDPADETKPIRFYVQKRRIKQCGDVGMARLKYDKASGRFSDYQMNSYARPRETSNETGFQTEMRF